jgi:hypothetical protein
MATAQGQGRQREEIEARRGELEEAKRENELLRRRVRELEAEVRRGRGE